MPERLSARPQRVELSPQQTELVEYAQLLLTLPHADKKRPFFTSRPTTVLEKIQRVAQFIINPEATANETSDDLLRRSTHQVDLTRYTLGPNAHLEQRRTKNLKTGETHEVLCINTTAPQKGPVSPIAFSHAQTLQSSLAESHDLLTLINDPDEIARLYEMLNQGFGFSNSTILSPAKP